MYMPPQMQPNQVPEQKVAVSPSEKNLRKLPEGYEYIEGGNGSYKRVLRPGDRHAAMPSNDENFKREVDELGRRKLPEGYTYIGKSNTYELISNKEKAPAAVKEDLDSKYLV
jgi:hypothetical protein